MGLLLDEAAKDEIIDGVIEKLPHIEGGDDALLEIAKSIKAINIPEFEQIDIRQHLSAIANALAALVNKESNEVKSYQQTTPIDYSDLISSLIDAVKNNTKAIQSQTSTMAKAKKILRDDAGNPIDISLS